jgi:hypothetical protein
MEITYLSPYKFKAKRMAWAYEKNALVNARNLENHRAPFGVYYVIWHYEFTDNHTPFDLMTAEHISEAYPSVA